MRHNLDMLLYLACRERNGLLLMLACMLAAIVFCVIISDAAYSTTPWEW